MNALHDRESTRERLEEKIKMLSHYIWESRAEGEIVSDWLSQFASASGRRERRTNTCLVSPKSFFIFRSRRVTFSAEIPLPGFHKGTNPQRYSHK